MRRSGGTSRRTTWSAREAKERSKVMPLIQLLEVLIVVGVLLWLVNRFIPMQSSIKSILNGVVVIAVVLWLLNVFGLFHSLSHIRVGT
jgi:flagellar biogenesis protein FliO